MERRYDDSGDGDASVEQVCDLLKVLGKKKIAALKEDVAKMPADVRSVLLEIFEGEEAEEEDKEKTKADSLKEVRAKEKEKSARFMSFYRMVLENMQRNREFFRQDGKRDVCVLVPAALSMQEFCNKNGNNADAAVKFVKQSVSATAGAQEMAFVCGIIEAKRWQEARTLFTRDPAVKAEFEKNGIRTWPDFVKAVDPNYTARRVDQLFDLYQAWKALPNISLISCCSIRTFLENWVLFKNYLLENDDAKEQWCRDEAGKLIWNHEVVFSAQHISGDKVMSIAVGVFQAKAEFKNAVEAKEQVSGCLRPMVERDQAEAREDQKTNEQLSKATHQIQGHKYGKKREKTGEGAAPVAKANNNNKSKSPSAPPPKK
jgi:hypothetical protein